MDLSDRNRKVAISRWKKVLETETARIPHDDKSTILKSAICGFLAGDGSVQVRKDKLPHHYQIDFFPDDKKMLDYYCKFIKKIYNKMPSLSRRDNVFVARLSHKYIVIDLLKYCNFGIYTWNLPIELFNVPGAKEAWLRGFFPAEGYVNLNKKYIKTQSVNIEGLKQVSSLLKGFGINNNIYEYIPKNKNHSKVLLLFIGSYDSRKIFQDKIGFWHLKKENLRVVYFILILFTRQSAL